MVNDRKNMVKEVFIPKGKVPTNRYFIAGREIYKETEARSKEKFGENSLAFKTIMNEIDSEDGKGSHFFFNNEVNLYLPEEQKVISLEDVERIYSFYNADYFFHQLNLTISEIILRTEIPSRKWNKNILENLVKQVKYEKKDFSPQNPLRISGLELIKDNNPENIYGLFLNLGQDTKMINDKRFAYAYLAGYIQLGNTTQKKVTKEEGLSDIYFNRYCLGSGKMVLSSSGDNDKIVIGEHD